MKVLKQFTYLTWSHIFPIVLIGLVFCTLGCTRVPDTDTEPPTISLLISGPAVGRQEMTNPPRETWESPSGTQYLTLDNGSEYGFVLTVTDQGGVGRAILRLPPEFNITELQPTSTVIGMVGVTRSLTLNGDRGAPTTGLVITGRFSVPESSVTSSYTFNVNASDFGGSSGAINQRFMAVSVVTDVLPD